MNVLSLFDGMSCAMLALEKAGIKVDNYYASELDKYAIKVSQENYPNIVQLGDINQWRTWDFPKIDLIIGGSPCQGFSFAGKHLAFDDPRSKLFFEYIAILRNVKCFNPNVKFLLENVKMKKSNLDIITEWIGVKPFFINSNLLTAQNRQRYYWFNWDVEQPDDKGILLRDILEDGYGGYAYNRNDGVKHPLDKAYPLNATDWRGLNRNQNQTAAVKTNFTFMSDNFIARQQGRKCLVDDVDKKAVSLSAMEYVKNGRQGDYIACQTGVIKSHGQWKDRPDKSQCIDANYACGVDNHGQRTMIECGALRGRYDQEGKTSQQVELRDDGKTNALTTVQKDNLLFNSTQYRKLTPIECERLQGVVPDNYTNHVSNTQRYKMLGNGFTVPVIAFILGGMYGKQEKDLPQA